MPLNGNDLMFSQAPPDSRSPPTPGCLTDEVLVDLLEGRLPDEALAAVHRHAAGCDDCRGLLATFTPGIQPPEGAAQEPPEPADTSNEPGLSWVPPDAFDAFRLEGPIGRGGMGVVFLAHDTSLDRRVAVKFLAASQPDARGRENFATEARALARRSRPRRNSRIRTRAIGASWSRLITWYDLGHSTSSLREEPRAPKTRLGFERGMV